MTTDFDQLIDRSGTGSNKWSTYRGGSHAGPITPIGPDLKGDGPIPMWVADMDFASPPPVLDALRARIDHGILGYTHATDSYFDAVTGWFKKRHGWEVPADWISTTPGVVPALHFAVKTWCQPGDKVLVQRPVYYPFFRSITNGGCEIVSNTLIEEAGVYTMDFDDLERKAADPKVKLAILCSPHNPIGRVWTADELRRFGEICNRHQVIVIADEIHGDLIMPGQRFQPYGQLGAAFADNAMICTAPSKTFNLAGMHLSNMVISNPELKQAYDGYMTTTGVAGGLNPLALVACEAAYRDGEPWLADVLAYIHGNFQTLSDTLATHLPMLKPTALQGTYLAWVDFRGLGLDQPKLEKMTQLDARVLLDEGHVFGPEGFGFERFNLACPRPVLALALSRLQDAIGRL
ncbi:MAG: pyridoxal phosphate-dependent aminotransferase [Rhodospirillales bacterium]|nr:pyridoxal phosphate-dependent aminotransferase [Rhodospirillales bacterium]